MLKHVRGGGGTNFIPVFEELKKLRRPPEVLVFATDGCGPAPQVQPPGMSVIWLGIGPYKQKPCEWGIYIEVDD